MQSLEYTMHMRECICVCDLCLVAHSCPTLCHPMDYSPPGSSVHGILQARILEWVAMPSSKGSSQPRDPTQVSHSAGEFFTAWATREVHIYVYMYVNVYMYRVTSVTMWLYVVQISSMPDIVSINLCQIPLNWSKRISRVKDNITQF